MYGIIHAFLRSTIVELCGSTAWTAIEAKAGASKADYYGLQQYPDEIALSMVEGAAAYLGQDLDATWRQIGARWVPYTQAGLYSSFYERAQGSLDFLEELNRIHAQVEVDLPLIQPPLFRLERVADNEARLHYISKRPGLGAFLQGALEGLAASYGETIKVSEQALTDPERRERVFVLQTTSSRQIQA